MIRYFKCIKSPSIINYKFRLTLGKIYKVISINDEYYKITEDDGEQTRFSARSLYGSYFKDVTKEEERKLKLEKLNVNEY